MNSTTGGSNGSHGDNISWEVTTRYSIVGHHEPALKVALEVLLTALLAFVMLAMGCDITWKDLWSHLRRPVGIAIGMASQFVVLPLCAFIIAHAFQLTVYQALSLLIVSCCPGGVASNLFTMWCKGSVSLSICMTTMSTFMALGLMPLNLMLYMQSWKSQSVRVPYDKMATTLVTILAPVIVGVGIRTWFPKAAVWVIRLGTTLGFLSIIATITIQSLLIPGLFNCGWPTYVSSFLLPLLGFIFGYGVAFVCRMTHKECRTVAMETGSQNIPLALTIILLSFPFDAQKEMAPIPLLFAIFVHIEAIVGALAFHWWLRRHKEETEVDPSSVLTSPPLALKPPTQEGTENQAYVEEEKVHANGVVSNGVTSSSIVRRISCPNVEIN